MREGISNNSKGRISEAQEGEVVLEPHSLSNAERNDLYRDLEALAKDQASKQGSSISRLSAREQIELLDALEKKKNLDQQRVKEEVLRVYGNAENQGELVGLKVRAENMTNEDLISSYEAIKKKRKYIYKNGGSSLSVLEEVFYEELEKEIDRRKIGTVDLRTKVEPAESKGYFQKIKTFFGL